jgi:hypothetical protein
MAKIAYKKSLIDTNITILALQKKKKKLMDSVSVQIYKIDIRKFIFVKKNIDFLIEILRKLFFTCNPHFVPPLFSD